MSGRRSPTDKLQRKTVPRLRHEYVAGLPITGASEIVTVRQATGHLLRCRIAALIEWTPIQDGP